MNYNKILPEDGGWLQKRWTRRLTYEFSFDDTVLKETLTGANLTVWLWPDKIIMTDDLLNPDNIDDEQINTGDNFKYYWSMAYNSANEKILYLDIPSDKL